MHIITTKHITNIKNSWFWVIWLWLLIAATSTSLDIPILRQILTFPILLFLPGILAINMLNLGKLDLSVKMSLAVGLSVSIIMFLGIFMSYVYRGLGYETPLYPNSIRITLFIVLALMVTINYFTNKESLAFPQYTTRFSNMEKLLLFIACLFLLLCIVGTYMMNSSYNNSVLLILLALIPIYVIAVSIFHRRISGSSYPIIIYLLGISVSLMLALRSNHIIGADTHEEFRFFTRILESGHFHTWGDSALDACLSISVLPAIYHHITGMEPEALFKLLYPVLFSFTPVVIYIIAKRYLDNRYAFLASVFFISQYFFIFTEAQARTSLAILFFSLFFLVITHRSIGRLNPTLLGIIIIVSMIVSHYSTTYIVFSILLASWLFMQILQMTLFRGEKGKALFDFKDSQLIPSSHNRVVTWSFLILIFAVVFFWYGQVTGVAFENGVSFVGNTIAKLNDFFVAEARGGAEGALGGGGAFRDIPTIIEFILIYASIFLISAGMLSVVLKYKETILPLSSSTRFGFLRDKLDIHQAIPAFAFWLLLGAVVLVPGLGEYSPERLFILSLVTLAPFLIVGAAILSNWLKTKPTLILLVIIIPLFMCNTGTMYQLFGVPKSVVLNSQGERYQTLFVHDSEVSAAQWIKEHCTRLESPEALKPWAYSDFPGEAMLGSQAKVIQSADFIPILQPKRGWYGWLLTRNVSAVDGLLLNSAGDAFQLGEYRYRFDSPSKLYSNGHSEVWMERWDYSRHWW